MRKSAAAGFKVMANGKWQMEEAHGRGHHPFSICHFPFTIAPK
jgi:hypothetical protein